MDANRRAAAEPPDEGGEAPCFAHLLDEGPVPAEADHERSSASVIRTLGHGTLSMEDFVALVRGAGLDMIVDVRRYPGSRRHPYFRSDEMARWLPEHGVDYRWLASLGGRRTPTPDSPNHGLRNEQFRAYADHMASTEFADGIADLRLLAHGRRAAVMCAESVWWRCHRRLLADHLVRVEETPVEHLFHDGRLVAHDPTPEARRIDGHLVYRPADQLF
jgi:uncharacterized protein (DUF488 family)